jgi:hypothetical protein
MIQVTYYKLATGQIVGSASGPLEDLEVNTPDGCAILQGMYSAEDYYVDVSTNTVVAMPPQPSTYHVFNYANKTWVDVRTVDEQWAIVRSERDRYLVASDWTQLPDVEITSKTQWATYRQALRDITDQPDPFNIVWPTPPQ